ncbi:hypothetical protein BGX33_007270 [Mortierella sp. NVP41]|nr:hypothetical protein BGX33_007270 [Mortierella sp. NVP41]
MSIRRQSPPIPEEAVPAAPIATDITATASTTNKRPSLSRSRASSNSVNSISSISSLNSLITSASTTTAAATISTNGSPTAVLSNGSSSSSTTTTTTTTTTPSSSSSGAFVPSSSNSSTYYPSFPYRNKSRTPSVSSTSTITQPIHSLLHTSTGILPKRHGSSTSAAPTLSTATASSTTASLTPSSSSSSSLSSAGAGSRSNSPPLPSKLTTTTAITAMNSGTGAPPHPILVLEPDNSGFAIKSLELPDQTRIKIGRQTGVATAPSNSNGYFDSKVLSRVHAEVWSDSGKVYIRDLKSSNGTFLNGRRLSAESVESEPFILNQNDTLEFGIDIMDENGSLLHEKVSCKIYISHLSYPTPGGSPQESQAKLKSGSSPGSANSFKSTMTTTSATAGQSANIDLIISRLQGELTRSQEANANLGILKQGLGDLEKSIVVSNKEDGSIPSPKSPEAPTQDTAAVNYEKQLEEHTQAHQAEIAKLNKTLEETQAELDAYIQKTQLLEPLVAEDEILKRDIAQSIAELSKVRLERDLAKDSMNELINEHQQVLETMRREQESNLAILEATHKDNMGRLARETALAQEALTLKFQEDLARVLESAAAATPAPVEPESVQVQAVDNSAFEKELALLQATVEQQAKKIKELQEEKAKQIQELREEKSTQIQELQEEKARHIRDLQEDKARQIRELQEEKATIRQALTEAKSEIVRTAKELKEVQERTSREELAPLTPTLAVNASSTALSHHQNGHAGATATTTSTTTLTAASSSQISEGNVSKYEFTWAQFVFPVGKKGQHNLKQPSSVLMSGSVVLVGLGAYVLWHKRS